MHRDPRVPLADVERAGADIKRFIDGITRNGYLRDELTQAAVERKFEIIGEALNRLHGSHPEYAARIPDLRRIIDFRNVLAHGYDSIMPANVWDHGTGSRAGGGGVWRVAFAFDPGRQAILLVAGDKSKVESRRFYARLIREADERFDAYLESKGGQSNRDQ